MRVISEGVRNVEESWEAWWHIEATEYEVRDFMYDNHINRYYGGPGSSYSDKPIIRRSSRRPNIVLITQSGGLDI